MCLRLHLSKSSNFSWFVSFFSSLYPILFSLLVIFIYFVSLILPCFFLSIQYSFDEHNCWIIFLCGKRTEMKKTPSERVIPFWYSFFLSYLYYSVHLNSEIQPQVGVYVYLVNFLTMKLPDSLFLKWCIFSAFYHFSREENELTKMYEMLRFTLIKLYRKIQISHCDATKSECQCDTHSYLPLISDHIWWNMLLNPMSSNLHW